MWCTRWFLPLLLLPLPTAPPFFLVLFLFSLTLHAKPCFYCIVLLTTLFVSSCYWQPFPIDSPLTSPWSENVTTFADALNATLKSSFTGPLPTVMHAMDRCWCDLSSGGFFEPFNVSRWEYLSVKRLSVELERGKDNSTVEDAHVGNGTQNVDLPINATHTGSPPFQLRHPTQSKFWWLRSPFPLRKLLPDEELSTSSTNVHGQEISQLNRSSTPEALPHVRMDYDLRPYGLGVTIDFAWS